jgi:hypothetical protein
MPASAQISAVRFKSISADSVFRTYPIGRAQRREYNRGYVAAKMFQRSPPKQLSQVPAKHLFLL